ncbi:hypothetical protein Y032_0323g2488 [Ancylostoma ceylanicum]|uniref:Uncharacterized protein n=1 Tax=Ancylostoma ceylanicum TaxID=53326 RepID=A0A016S195_9BILA|nr:hypothetical protein Y032_0323g2488 [Ancylostoma ceylanicum]
MIVLHLLLPRQSSERSCTSFRLQLLKKGWVKGSNSNRIATKWQPNNNRTVSNDPNGTANPPILGIGAEILLVPLECLDMGKRFQSDIGDVVWAS